MRDSLVRTRAFSRRLCSTICVGIPTDTVKRSVGTSSRHDAVYYVYVLQNREGRHYIGSCEDIATRLKKHNQNSVRSTKHKGPFKIIHKEKFSNRTEARKRENQLKSYKNPAYLRSILGIA